MKAKRLLKKLKKLSRENSMSLKSQLIDWLRKANTYSNKKLGQNFLISQKALNEIVEAGNIQPSDNILEIGPGTGILTNELLKTKANVVVVERDRKLCEVLTERFSQEINKKQLTVINNDFLKLPFPNFLESLSFKKYKVVANLPYQITSPVLKTILEKNHLPKLAVLTIQKEVAERISAKPGKMSSIGVIVQSVSTPKIISHFPPSYFYPPPKVDSALITLSNISYPEDIDFEKLKKIVKAGFLAKRKMLKNNLTNLTKNEDKVIKILKSLDIDLKARAQDLNITDWHNLAKLLNI